MSDEAASGWCLRCRRRHRLGYGGSQAQALRLIDKLLARRNLDFTDALDPRLTIDSLFTPGGGKMFGLLICRDGQGEDVALSAFSGQYNGLFTAPGWSPPLFPAGEYQRLAAAADQRIKALDAAMANLAAHEPLFARLRQERRAISRALMPRLHDLYQLKNQRGEEASMRQAWAGPGGIPCGAGDCCAPKLLCEAARRKLRPLGLCEFFFGDGGVGRTARRHLEIYPACAEKCQPLLGFLLCGLNDVSADE